MQYELEARNITKRFSATLANDNVSLCVKAGEVHALVGENGAGKSTLMNILYGMLSPDSGEILYRGKQVRLKSPNDALALGIGMVHQHFMLSPSLSVAENIVLGKPPKRKFVWKPNEFRKEIERIQEEFDLKIPLDTKVQDISVGLMQRVEIIKILFKGARLIILDEPTATLTPQETKTLFQTIRKLTKRGYSIIFITHKLREVMEISDRITAMRAGKTIGTVNTSEVQPRDIARMMIGRDIDGLQKSQIKTGTLSLEIKDLTVIGDQKKIEVDNFSLRLYSGEILGIAGVEGNGQTELSEAIIGVRNITSGSITLNGKTISNDSVRNRMLQGLAHIPQDRMREGLALSNSITENIIINKHNVPPIAKRGIINWKKARELSKALIQTYSIKTPSEAEHAKNLSGGNMQKIIVARELSRDPNVVVACQPTRGVDIGSSKYIRQMLVNVRERGGAVLLISADLDEILELCDRIIVIYEGRISGELLDSNANEEKLGQMMFGTHYQEARYDVL
ncbi:ABC transporter ATP-binding protein [Bacillus sp. S3]|uniref:ABC transporter ATP-binding protein n=1 Tax=Bacillus sp. S3 TaxID=486398 RepID=UPI001CC1C98C|nr:ABC transporter ATP-binding protein [Bacillus sp. S3]